MQLLGKPTGWHISLYHNGLWNILGDPAPWAAVKKFIPGPEVPTEA